MYIISKSTQRTNTIVHGDLTPKALEMMGKNTVFAHGVILNGPAQYGESIHMTDSNIGRELMWAAVRGVINDWCIYVHWSENGLDYVLNNGDKIINPDNIRALVPCTEEALKLYRL